MSQNEDKKETMVVVISVCDVAKCDNRDYLDRKEKSSKKSRRTYAIWTI